MTGFCATLLTTGWFIAATGVAAVREGGMIELEGQKFGGSEEGEYSGPQQQVLAARWKAEGKDVLARTVNFPARGVWYIWLKVRCPGPWPAVLTYSLDGVQPLMSTRKEVLVQPSAEPGWITWSRFPGFRIEVNVDKPGEHILRFNRTHGNVEIEKILLTLYFSAKLAGDILDMTGDPGGGKIDFPLGGLSVDGFRGDFRSPEIKAAGTVYYVDPEKGDDGGPGTPAGKPWRTVNRVNAATFKPGDAILLKRGTRFPDGLAPRGNGTEKAWITIGAWGEGDRPLVRGVDRPGLALADQSYWIIQDLAFSSDPEYRRSAMALKVSEGAPRARGAKIINCVAFDSGAHGIEVGGEAGYDGVLIENCLSFCNSGDGIVVGGSAQKGSARNTVIRHCTAYSNPGMAGIWIESAENGLIEDCLAYNNACVNIWTWNAVNVTMRHCEVFRGRPQRDAAGFDIDWGSEACTLEYCYSHHNEGDEFLLMGSGDGTYLDFTMQSNHNIMRYCVAEGHSPIDMGETFNHCLVYNNLSVAVGPGSYAFKVFGWPNDESGANGGWPVDTEVCNNIFVALKGATAMYVDDHGADQGNHWDYNIYWQEGKPRSLVKWGGRANGPGFWNGDSKTGSFPPKEYADLAVFRGETGQEAHGLEADPKLIRPGSGEYGRLPLKSARLAAGSPAQGAGRKSMLTKEWLAARRKHLTDTGAEAWGIPMDPEPDTRDYWGDALGEKVSIGPQK